MADAVHIDTDTDLTLEISGHRVTPEKFLRGVRAFFGVVQGVTKEVCADLPKVEWLVQVKAGSNLVGVRAAPGYPHPEIIGTIARAVREGIRTLETKAEEPPDFDVGAVRDLRKLARIAGTDDQDDTEIRVWAELEPVPITYSSVAHVTALLRTTSEDYGSVEGRLQVASERGDLHVVVYEPLWDKPVRCFLEEEMLPEALSYFRQRVEVYGLIKYRRDGQPVSIDVEEIVPFPDKHVIPTAESVRGILKSYS